MSKEFNDLLDRYDSLPDEGMRKYDCIALIEAIVKKEGWDRLYKILEKQKVIMNLPI